MQEPGAHPEAEETPYTAAFTAALLAAPTNDHCLPLRYTPGLRDPHDRLAFFNDQFGLGSLSTRSIILP